MADHALQTGTGGNDTITVWGYHYNTIVGGAGNDTIEFLYHDVFGGYGISGTVINYAEGDGNDVVYNLKRSNKFYVDNLTINLNPIWSYSTVASGNDVILVTKTGSIRLLNGPGFANVRLNMNFTDDSDSTFISTPYGTPYYRGAIYERRLDASARTQAIAITGNEKDNLILGGSGNDTLDGGSDADKLWGSNGNDVLIGGSGNDTLWGGNGNDTLRGGAGSDLFVYESGNDVIADYVVGDKISIGSAADKIEISGKDALLVLGNDTLTVKNGLYKDLKLIQADNTLYTIAGGISLDKNSASKVTIDSAVKFVSASHRKNGIRILGNALNNTIIGGSGSDSLNGGKGNDKLVGGSGNDTFVGGEGKDVFVYSGGKDVITDYAAGDRISLGAAITKATLKGNDAVITVGKGTLTVKDGKDKRLTFITSGKQITTIVGGMVYDNSSAAKVTLGSAIRIGDASDRTTAIRITGNTKDNSIVGGSGNDTLSGGAGADTLNGGAGNDSINGGSGNDYILGGAGNDKLYGYTGNDTLQGGAGNDSLWGQAGADTFLYNSGDGKDIIYGFDDTDMLQITGDFTATYYKGSNKIAFKVGSTYNAITLKDFTATTFNVNGESYAISNNKFVKK